MGGEVDDLVLGKGAIAEIYVVEISLGAAGNGAKRDNRFAIYALRVYLIRLQSMPHRHFIFIVATAPPLGTWVSPGTWVYPLGDTLFIMQPYQH